jgi:predicted CoA-binding protein
MVSGTVSAVDVLAKSKTIAVVGASKNPEKEAYGVPSYLREHGYRIVPVNPTADEILGERAYPSLLELPEGVVRAVDVVEVFRPSNELPQVARQADELKRRYGRPLFFWAQLGLENEEAKRILEGGGIQYVMDACMRTVHQLHFKQQSG